MRMNYGNAVSTLGQIFLACSVVRSDCVNTSYVGLRF
jgi:hypothetical protein